MPHGRFIRAYGHYTTPNCIYGRLLASLISRVIGLYWAALFVQLCFVPSAISSCRQQTDQSQCACALVYPKPIDTLLLTVIINRTQWGGGFFYKKIITQGSWLIRPLCFFLSLFLLFGFCAVFFLWGSVWIWAWVSVG